jgi:hypothetical protein
MEGKVRSRRISTVTVTGTALLMAMGAVLPIVFHGMPLGGRIFLPMHIPALVAGLLLGPVAGLVVGAGSPILSLVITGRPPLPLMLPMVFELAAYGLVAGLVRARMLRAAVTAAGATGLGAARRSRSPYQPSVWVPLLAAMVAGRIVWVIVVVWAAPFIGITARSLAMGLAALGAGWVGIVVQLVLIPPIVRAIEGFRNT